MELIAALAVGIGLAAIVVALMTRSRARQDDLQDLLDLPYAEEDIDPSELAGRLGLLRPTAGAVDDVLHRMDLVEKIGAKLERARIALRPGEYVLLAAGATFAIAFWAMLWSGSPLSGIPALVIVPLAFVAYLDHRVGKRQRMFEEQLPPTLGLIASSLKSGHTLLKSIDMMVEETPPPMKDEFERVLAETRLGLPLIDALERMARRVEVTDMEWIVHAIRIQQSTGGKLADLLFTLADYMREREEVRREVKVLTAEGRFSGLVLLLLPIFIGGWIQFSNPDYFEPFFSMTGLIMIVYAVVSMVIGGVVMMRMVKAVEL